MGTGSWIHWVAVILVVVLVFGTKKLGNLGGDLGRAVKGFKDGIKGVDEEKDKAAAPANQQVAEKSTIDVDAKEKSKS